MLLSSCCVLRYYMMLNVFPLLFISLYHVVHYFVFIFLHTIVHLFDVLFILYAVVLFSFFSIFILLC